jgi:hypothetical protein
MEIEEKLREIIHHHLSVVTLPDNFSTRSAETDKKRLAKPFYCKTIFQIVFNKISIL